MVDPQNVTIYDRDDRDLQEFFIFSVCGRKDAPAVATFIRTIDRGEGELNPLTVIYLNDDARVTRLLKLSGIGCSSQKTLALKHAAVLQTQCREFLRACTLDDLEQIPYVGPKNARFFLLHSRMGVRAAALDTHILKHLSANGVPAPKTTPPKGERYRVLEAEFLKLADASGMTPADYDLKVRKQYAKA
jgi:hypothetical protein